MKPSKNDILVPINHFINEHSIDPLKYNLKSSLWWEGRVAILTQKYSNFSGEVIEKESIICILFKMQVIRFESVYHTGQFYVRDLTTGVCIGGIDHTKLVLTGKIIQVVDC